ncbi:M-phase phosphoprotein 6 [Rhynchophorus ferrugineus]|uniref:M-phase phosphoprotein 6 n=1 Tax=Rhynchophorus ferrugineus TaxID=354439 RepID=UPI003FCE2019
MAKEVKLSKAILEMKFMKKTKEKVAKEEENAESREMYSHEITEEMKKNGNIIFRPASITVCKRLVDGRLSFGGMNPEVEKMMENDYNKRYTEAEKKKEKDITDEEMAIQHSTVATISNKFKSKRNRNKKFQKPRDEPLL